MSTAFGCPYEGPVTPAQVRAVAEKLFEMGVEEVVLGNEGVTAGAHPGSIIAIHSTIRPATVRRVASTPMPSRPPGSMRSRTIAS